MFFVSVFPQLIFVELESHNVHVLDQETGMDVDTVDIKDILHRRLQIAGPVCGHPDGDMWMYEKKGRKSGVESSNIVLATDHLGVYTPPNNTGIDHPKQHRGDMHVQRLPTDISINLKSMIDSTYVNTEGVICFLSNGKCIETGIGVRDLLDEPKIIKSLIFLASKRNRVVVVKGTTLFVVAVKVEIIDTFSRYSKVLELTYMHHPFSSTCADVEISSRSIRLKKTGIVKNFDARISSVYECKVHEGGVYLSKIYPSSSISIYRGRKTSSRAPWALVFGALALLLFTGGRKVKVQDVVYETKSYKMCTGRFDKSRVTVKVYKGSDRRILHELEFLKKHHCPYLARYIYKERAGTYLYIVLENTCSLEEATITDKKKFGADITDAMCFLHSKSMVYYNLAPRNVRVNTQNSPVLTNFEDVNSMRKKSLGVVDWRSADLILSDFDIVDLDGTMRSKADVFSLGLILYYLEYNEHAFSSDTESISNVQRSHGSEAADTGPHTDSVASGGSALEAKTTKSSVFYKSNKTGFAISEIEQNILSDRFRLQTIADQTLYSLVTYCIKRHHTDRYSMDLVKYHPYFWSSDKAFHFLANLSDIVENKGAESSILYRRLERNKLKIFKDRWVDRLDAAISENLCTYRIYNFSSVPGLLRAIRNKGRHYKELPENIKAIYNSFPAGFVDYYVKRFPRLMMVGYISASCMAAEESLAEFYPQR